MDRQCQPPHSLMAAVGCRGKLRFRARRALCRISSQPLCLCIKAEKESLLLFSSFPLRISERLMRVGTANIVPLFSLGEMKTLRALQLLAQGQYRVKNLKSQFLNCCCVSGNLLHVLRAHFYESIMIME